jgi:anti-sigma regulatory factor (Ser/Thr protein kinase)
MSGTASHRLPFSPVAPRLARELLGEIDELACKPDLCFSSQLLASELVANCIRHGSANAEGGITLSVECDEDTLRVEVRDGGTGFDPLARLREHYRRDARHHGMVLLDALADCWGYRRTPGCLVWFEIDLVPGRRPWRGRVPIPRLHNDR